jgi:hypothetical protein
LKLLFDITLLLKASGITCQMNNHTTEEEERRCEACANHRPGRPTTAGIDYQRAEPVQ